MGILGNSEDCMIPDHDKRLSVHLHTNLFQIDRNVGIISCTGVTGIVATDDPTSLDTLHELSRKAGLDNAVVTYRNFTFILDSVKFVEDTSTTTSGNSNKSKKFIFRAQDVRLESLSLA